MSTFPPLSSPPVERLAVLGYGYWGPNHVRVFCEMLGAERVVVCEPDPARREVARERHPGIGLAADLDGLLAGDSPQAASICTPAELHFGQVRQLLEGGCHVLVEKPLALSSKEGDALAALAERRGRVLMAGDIYFFHPAVQALRGLVADGTLGEVRYITCIRSSLGPRVRTGVNVIWDYLIHNAYIIPYLLGREPLMVRAAGGSWLHEGVPDVVFAEMFFRGGAVAHLQSSWYYPVKERRMVVVGSRRMAVWDEERPPTLAVHECGYEPCDGVDARGNEGLRLYDGGMREVTLDPAEPLKAECAHFLECIASGCEPRSGGRQAAQNLWLLEAMDWSLKEQGRRVPVHNGGLTPEELRLVREGIWSSLPG